MTTPTQASYKEDSIFPQATFTVSSTSAASSHLYLKRDPMRMNPERAEFFCTGPLSLKKAWCSTAHFQRCLHALGWSILKTKVCSCSFPWGEGGGRTEEWIRCETAHTPVFSLVSRVIITRAYFNVDHCYTKGKYLRRSNTENGCSQHGLACRGGWK